MLRSIFTLPAFAKINLHLKVLGKRPDGYHELDTIFQTVSLHDTITFTETEDSDIAFWCDDPSLPSGPDNLVWRAAQTLRQHFSVNRGARIRLEKRIPAQAGLGGGSANAAVTLFGLAHLWKLTPTAAELLSLANKLGADVPFFLFGGTARGTGIGGDIAALSDAGTRYVLIVKPNATIPTAEAYESLNSHSLTSVDAKTILSSSLPREIFDSFHTDTLQNDFEEVIFALAPEIQRSKIALEKAGAHAALLAGSGAAVFGLFDNEDAQKRAIQAIELEAGWRVFPCKTVARSQYRNALGEAGTLPAHFHEINFGA